MTYFKIAFLALFVAALCPQVASADNVPSQHSQNALVIFYRMRHLEMSAQGEDISVGDKQYCDLGNHDVCAIIIPSGNVGFKIAPEWDLGHLDFPVTLEAGKTYYIQVTMKSGMPTAGALPYLLSNKDMPVNSVCRWGNCAIVMPEDAAKADLQAEKLFPSIPFNW